MRVAIVSDIHGNLTAFEAVLADLARQPPGLVLHGGDLALMGPQPAQVVDRVRDLGWEGVVGNTDELLWDPCARVRQEGKAPALRPLLDLIFDQYAPATAELLGQERIAWLQTLPAEHRSGDLALVHASPGDLWRAPLPDADDEQLLAT